MLFSTGRFCLLAFAVSFVCLTLGSTVSADESADGGKTTDSEVHSEESHSDGHDDHSHSEDGHGDADQPTLLQFDFGSALINLLIFAGVFTVLSVFVWPTILGGLQARESKIHDDLSAAEQANAEAKTLLADYQSKLDDAANQVQEMLASARRDAESAGQRIVDEAKEEATRQRERALGEIDTAKKVAISELAGQTSDMAIQVAKQVVGRELKAEDHADLIRQSLERLPSNN